MKRNTDYEKRRERVMRWYAPGRLGLFYHWGFFTGGGQTEPGNNYVPMVFRNAAEFEAAAPEPEIVAANMVAAARKFGAKYINFTCFHGASGFAVMFPTRQPEFLLKTSRDYVGALIEECARHDIKPMFYLSMICERDNLQGAPYLDNIRTQAEARELYGRLIEEMGERYDKSKIGGFWLDCGFTPPFLDFPAFIRGIFPDAIIAVNSSTFIQVKDADYSVTEFLAFDPEPSYNRPSGLTGINSYGIGAPPDDFNEDIPLCGSWWHWENPGKLQSHIEEQEKDYLEDSNFLLRQMISSIGQRGQWNFTLGIPIRLDGTIADKYQPMFEKVSAFMSWGSEAVYNTTGGKFSPIPPGAFHGGGFCSVTVPLDRRNICYILITRAPDPAKGGFFLEHPGKKPYAAFFTNGHDPVRVSDLRTGNELDFELPGGMGFRLKDWDIDWSEVDTYGVKVLKVEFQSDVNQALKP